MKISRVLLLLFSASKICFGYQFYPLYNTCNGVPAEGMPTGISKDGQTVVGWEVGPGAVGFTNRSFVYRLTSPNACLTQVNPPTGPYTWRGDAMGVSEDGYTILAEAENPSILRYEAYLEITDPNPPHNVSTQKLPFRGQNPLQSGRELSADAKTVIGSDRDTVWMSPMVSKVWDNHLGIGVTTLPIYHSVNPPMNTTPIPAAVSYDGSVIAANFGYPKSPAWEDVSQALIWDPNIQSFWPVFGLRPAYDTSEVAGLSADGVLAVGASNRGPFVKYATFWNLTNGFKRQLRIDNLVLGPGNWNSEAFGVSLDGKVVVGRAYRPFGTSVQDSVAIRWTCNKETGGFVAEDIQAELQTHSAQGWNPFQFWISNAKKTNGDGTYFTGQIYDSVYQSYEPYIAETPLPVFPVGPGGPHNYGCYF